jgi:hypothetical protein
MKISPQHHVQTEPFVLLVYSRACKTGFPTSAGSEFLRATVKNQFV